MIDEIIALIRGSRRRRRGRATGLMAEPFEFSEVAGRAHPRHAAAPPHPPGPHRPREELAELRETIAELEAILADDAVLRGVIKDELAAVREKFATPAAGRDHLRPRRHRHRGPHRRRGPRRHVHPQGLHQDDAGRRLPDAGPRRPGRAGRQAPRRGLRHPHHPHHGPRLPAVLLQPGAGLPPEGARDPQEGAHGPGHGHRQPAAARSPSESIQAIIDTRDYATNRFLFFATRKGQVKKTKFTEYDKRRRGGPHRHQPARRRRAGEGDPHQRRATTSSWSAARA